MNRTLTARFVERKPSVAYLAATLALFAAVASAFPHATYAPPDPAPMTATIGPVSAFPWMPTVAANDAAIVKWMAE